VIMYHVLHSQSTSVQTGQKRRRMQLVCGTAWLLQSNAVRTQQRATRADQIVQGTTGACETEERTRRMDSVNRERREGITKAGRLSLQRANIKERT